MCFSSLPVGLGFLGCSDLCYTTLHGSGLSLCVAVCMFQDLHGGCFSGWKDIFQLTCTRKPRVCPACRYSCWHIRMLMDSPAGIEFSFCDLRGAWGVGVMGWWPVARSLWLLTACSACPAPGWALVFSWPSLSPVLGGVWRAARGRGNHLHSCLCDQRGGDFLKEGSCEQPGAAELSFPGVRWFQKCP